MGSPQLPKRNRKMVRIEKRHGALCALTTVNQERLPKYYESVNKTENQSVEADKIMPKNEAL